MSEDTGRRWKIRGPAYLVLAVMVAVLTPSPDVITLLMYFLAGLVLFELGFFAYRRRRG